MNMTSRKTLIALVTSVYILALIGGLRVVIAGIFYTYGTHIEDHLKAIDWYERAISLDASCPEYYNYIVESYLTYARFPLLTERYLDRAEALGRKGLSICPLNSRLWLDLARVSEMQGHLSRAEARYLKAIYLDPNNALYRTELAAFYIKRGRVQKGMQELQRARQDYPGPFRDILRALERAGIDKGGFRNWK
jgi:tetratricopeptide (TPR) repeat protein